MGKTRGVPCECGGAAVTVRTDTVDVYDPDEVFRGVKIAQHKFQHRRCAACGAEGVTAVFIGETAWKEKHDTVQGCTAPHQTM